MNYTNKLIPKNLNANSKLELQRNIAQTENYGWDHPTDRDGYDKEKLKRTVDPGEGFGIGSYWTNGWNYFLDMPTDNSRNIGNKYDRAYFWRHIGFPRDMELMPLTEIRFSGDRNEDGSDKYPNAEYVGLPNETKRWIQQGIENGKISSASLEDYDTSSAINPYGLWTPVRETSGMHDWSKKTSHLGNYSIRENNGSGIYDVVDTYDFAEGIGNRKPGYQIEVRDTIHGKYADPSKYDKNFSSKKAKERATKKVEPSKASEVARKAKYRENHPIKSWFYDLIGTEY